MPLTEDDHVIEALSTDGSNQTFDISVLPRRASGGRAVPNAHCSETSFEYLTVGGVTVTDEIRGRGIVRLTGFELPEIFTRGGRPISEMAEEAGMSSSCFTRMLRLSFLAPDITQAILHGRQPADLNAHKLMADTRAPIDWHEQRAGLGFL